MHRRKEPRSGQKEGGGGGPLMTHPPFAGVIDILVPPILSPLTIRRKGTTALSTPAELAYSRRKGGPTPGLEDS